MRKLVQSLPFAAEFSVVVAGAFGLTIITGVLLWLAPDVAAHFTGSGIWRGLARQIIVLIVLGLFLWARGWNGEKLGLNSHWLDGLYGLGLAVAAYLAFYLVFIVVASVAPALVQPAAGGAGSATAMSVWLAASLILIDPLYEELFVTGYVIAALKGKVSDDLAVNVSVLLRIAFHLHQGLYGVVMMIPLGLVFAYWYIKRGTLWPVILADVALSAISILPQVKW